MPTVQRHGDLRPAHLVTRRPQLHSRETVLHVILSDRAVRGGFRPQPLVFRDALADCLEREVDAAHVERPMLEWERCASRVCRRARAAWHRYWIQRSSRRILHGRECFEEILRHVQPLRNNLRRGQPIVEALSGTIVPALDLDNPTDAV